MLISGHTVNYAAKLGMNSKPFIPAYNAKKRFCENCFNAHSLSSGPSSCHSILLEVILQTGAHPTVGNPSKYHAYILTSF